ncbi:MAG: aminotransferase class V-fold PLP-dependent enzyme [Actinobacteria bacterium]|nr:aminotransferase class V-fold PLP-dependent enzyme [Actinomycetota bacterium]
MAPAKGKPFEDYLLNQIRNRFAYVDEDPYSGKRIYFENAGGSLTLKSVLSLLPEVAGLPDNAGRQNKASQQIGEILRKGVEDVKTFLNAKEGTILAGESTTSNIFRILDACTSSCKGTNIVCTNLDHASFFDATRFFAEKSGLEMRVARLDPATGAVPYESITALVDEGTMAVGFIHASNVTGVKNDAQKIVREIRKKRRNTFIVVDGAQHAQHCPIDVNDLGVDAYLVAAYKLFSKVGLTFAYTGPKIAELLHWRLRGKPVDSWDLGTRDASGYAAFSAAIDYLCWLGNQVEKQARPNCRGYEGD